jgi:hypothetical protein
MTKEELKEQVDAVIKEELQNMSDDVEKDLPKVKELRHVVVVYTGFSDVMEEHYRIIVPPDSTVEKEMAWRMDWLDPEIAKWRIDSDKLIRRIENG